MKLLTRLLVCCLLLAGAYALASPASELPAKYVLALYEGGYGNPEGSGAWRLWNAEGHDPATLSETGQPDLASVLTPEGGPYDSTDSAVLEGHLRQARINSIDAFIVRWGARGGQEEACLAKLLPLAERDGALKITCLVDASWPGEPYEVASALDYLLSGFGASPAWFAPDGTRVLFLSEACVKSLTGDEWLLVFKQLDTKTYKWRLVPQVAPSVLAEQFGAFSAGLAASPFGPYGAPDETYSYLVGEGRRLGLLTAPVLSTGFSPNLDQVMQAQGYQFTPETWQEQLWRFLIPLDPDWIVLDSFNDWVAGTQVEPSLEKGEGRLRVTRRWADAYTKGAFIGVGSYPASVTVGDELTLPLVLRNYDSLARKAELQLVADPSFQIAALTLKADLPPRSEVILPVQVLVAGAPERAAGLTITGTLGGQELLEGRARIQVVAPLRVDLALVQQTDSEGKPVVPVLLQNRSLRPASGEIWVSAWTDEAGSKKEWSTQAYTAKANSTQFVKVPLSFVPEPGVLYRLGAAATFGTAGAVAFDLTRPLGWGLVNPLTARVDGALDEWAGKKAFYLSETREMEQPGKFTRISPIERATCWLGYDDNFLYLAAEVPDEMPTNSHSKGLLWRGDALTVGLSTAGEATALPAPDDCVLQLALTDKGPVLHSAHGPGKMQPERFYFKVKHSEGITSYEVAVPWALLGRELSEGALLRANVVLHATDSPRTEATSFALAPGLAEGASPVLWPTFILAP